ncbi:anti-sigma factor [Geodermatophilus sp. SYSU D00815]
MPHCTPEQLALAALREPLPAPDAEHLAGCPQCAREVASLRRSVDALAVPQLAAPTTPVAPPPSVWEAIAERTGVTARPRPEVVASPLIPAPEPPPAPVVPLARPRRTGLLVAAAAAVVVAAAGTTAVVLASRDDATVVAAAALDPLDDAPASGTAEVVVRDGERLLEVRLDAAAPDDGYYEVWLIDERVEGMYSLGVVREGTTDLPLPEGIDLTEYPIVDVSVEPLDGDPRHSGDSVARGVLES